MNARLRLTWRSFSTPKAGHTPDEYEDACAGNPEHGRFAIADGASESAFADVWARALVEAYVHSAGSSSNWLAAARESWRARVKAPELSWYAEAKFREGAYAAMLGVAFINRGWRATAIGDCCLFQMRDDHLVQAFPMQHSSEFGNRPSLLCSGDPLSTQLRPRRARVRGQVHPRDDIWLMTDALAEWFSRKAEQGQQPWRELHGIVAEDGFASFIDRMRNTRELHNDDATLMLIQVRTA